MIFIKHAIEFPIGAIVILNLCYPFSTVQNHCFTISECISFGLISLIQIDIFKKLKFIISETYMSNYEKVSIEYKTI